MAFQFTPEDFERYVKASEHGGRHIWHELEGRLSTQYDVPFTTDHYARRRDPLQLLWLRPAQSPRENWMYQAKLFLSRIMHQSLFVGLHIQRPPLDFFSPEQAAKEGWRPPSDGVRFLERLRSDSEFRSLVGQLLDQPQWEADIKLWDGVELFRDHDVIESLLSIEPEPNSQGLDIYFGRTIPKDEAIAAGEAIVDQIVEAYQTLDPVWMQSIPDEESTYLMLGGPSAGVTSSAGTSLSKSNRRKPELRDRLLGLIKTQLEA